MADEPLFEGTGDLEAEGIGRVIGAGPRKRQCFFCMKPRYNCRSYSIVVEKNAPPVLQRLAANPLRKIAFVCCSECESLSGREKADIIAEYAYTEELVAQRKGGQDGSTTI